MKTRFNKTLKVILSLFTLALTLFIGFSFDTPKEVEAAVDSSMQDSSFFEDSPAPVIFTSSSYYLNSGAAFEYEKNMGQNVHKYYVTNSSSININPGSASTSAIKTSSGSYFLVYNFKTQSFKTNAYLYTNSTYTLGDSDFISSSGEMIIRATKQSGSVSYSYYTHIIMVPKCKVVYSNGTTSNTYPTQTNQSFKLYDTSINYIKSSGPIYSPIFTGFSYNGTTYTNKVVEFTQESNGFTITDSSGSQRTVVIDKTAPTITISSDNNDNNGTHYSAVKISISDNFKSYDASSFPESFTRNGIAINQSISSIIADAYDDDGTYYLKVADNAGNYTEKTWTIAQDNTTPTFSVVDVNGNSLNSGSKTNTSQVTVSVSDNIGVTSFSYIKDTGNPYNLNSLTRTITEPGVYVFTALDKNLNPATFTITIDRTLNSGKWKDSNNNTITVKTDGSTITNKQIKYEWNDSDATATISKNGGTATSYTEGTLINEDGTYTITLSDGCNIVTSTVILDFTAPTGTLTGVTNGGITNTDVSFTWSESGATASYKTSTQTGTTAISTKPFTFTADGSYRIEISDGLNVSIYTFEIDKTAATGKWKNYSTSSTLTDGSRVNYPVKFDFDESGSTATLNGEPYIEGYEISAEGVYELILTDSNQLNTKIYTITLDYTAPTATLNGVENGGVTNETVTISWSESGATATLNGQAYTKGTAVTEEGVFEFEISDGLNVSTYTFEIDYTAATGKWKNYSTSSTLTDGSRVNYPVKFDFDESGSTATLNGEPYIEGYEISAEGTYELILTDSNQLNTKTYTITLDYTAPTGTLTGVTNGGKTNSNVYFTFTEIGATATLNGEPYTSNSLISSENSYCIEISDGLNVSTYTFEIDKTPVEVTLTGVTNGGKTNGVVTASWSENNVTAYLNGEPYTKRQEIKAEDDYELIIIDDVNNITRIYFSIDTTAPSFKINPASLQNNGITNTNVAISFTEGQAFLNGEPYTSGSVISAENSYLFEIYDDVSNKNQFVFVIDKTPVEVTLTGVTNGGKTNGIVTASWSENNVTAYLNGEPYTKRQEIKAEGSYILIVWDFKNLNSVVFNFEIDKTNVEFGLYNSKNEELLNSSNYDITEIYNSNYSNGLYFSWSENGATATLNDEPYTSGKLITEEGIFVFEITDELGNAWEFVINLDYTPYTKNYDYFVANNNNQQNHWFETFDYYFDTSSNSYKKNSTYSFSTYTAVYQYALNREKATIETGVFNGSTIWSTTYNQYIDNYDFTSAAPGLNYYIYKDAAGKPYAYFSTEAKDNMVLYYVDKSIVEKWIPSKPAPAAPGEDLTLDVIYIKNSSISFNYKPSDVLLYINNLNSPVSYNTVITTEGVYNVVEKDSSNNEISYILVLDNSLADFVVTDLNGNAQPTLQNYFATQQEVRCTTPIQVKALDDYDENVVIYVDGVPYIYNSNEDGFIFNTTGNYSIYAIDAAGNKTKTITLMLSLEILSATMTDIYAEDKSLAGFDFKINLSNSLNKIENIMVYLYTETDGSILLTKDSYGTAINDENLNYHFEQSGSYTIIVTDLFGRTYEWEHEIQRDRPLGKLYTIDGSTTNYLQNGFVSVDNDGNIIKNNPAVTRLPFYLTWDDETVKAYFLYEDGTKVEYIKNTKITTKGNYIICLENSDSKITYFSVSLDKTAPTGIFYSADDSAQLDPNDYTNKSVYFVFDEEDATATLNGIEYKSGTIINKDGTATIYLQDKAGNVATYSINIKKSAPLVTISSGSINYSSGSYANKNITFSWTESNCSFYLDGVFYNSGVKSVTVKTEGVHVLQIKDRYNNEATYTIIIDKSNGVGNWYDENGNVIANASQVNHPIYFSWSENDVLTAYVNGIEYVKNTLLTEDAVYNLTLTDLASNTVTYIITLTTKVPTGTLTGVTNGGVTNSNVSFTWTGNDCTATLNGQTYTKGTTIRNEGVFEIILKSKANNTSTYTFEIDKTAEPFTVYGLNENDYSNNFVYFVWEDTNCKAYIDGIEYEINSLIELPGSHLFELIDQANNISSKEFTILSEKPILTLNNVTEDGTTNQNVTITWNNKLYTVTISKDGEEPVPYTSGSLIKAEADYHVIAVDVANNITEIHFTIDKTPVEVTLTGVTNGGKTNGVVTASWNESNVTAYLNGVIYFSGTEINIENIYELVVYDESLNETILTWEIIHTAPTGTLNGVTNGGITNSNVSFTWDGNDYTATLNGQAYTKGATIKAENTYTLILEYVGNQSIYTFEIDKTLPTGSLVNVTNGGYTNTPAIFVFEEGTATLNGTPYTSGTEISSEGENFIVLTDEANNQSFYSFTILSEIPTLTLNGVENGGSTNQNVTITWNNKLYTVTVNGKKYENGTIIKAENSYLVEVYDICSNYNSYSFSIDKTPVEVTLTGVTNGGKTKDNVIATFTEIGATATLNGENYSSGAEIIYPGLYELIVWDLKNLNSVVFNFEIDTIPVEVTLTGVENNGRTNTAVTVSWDELGCTATISRNGGSTTSYTKNTTINKHGSYKICVYDNVSNVKEILFEIDLEAPTLILNNVVNNGVTNGIVTASWEDPLATATLSKNGEEPVPYYNNNSIYEDGHFEIIISDGLNAASYKFTINTSAPTGTLNGVENGGITNSNVSFTWSESGATATLNGEPYASGSIISQQGLYEIVLKNELGSYTTYTFEIFNERPSGLLIGNFNENNKTKEPVIFEWYENSFVVTINGEPYTSGTLITENNFYEIIVTNFLGTTNRYTFEIDTIPVEVTLTGVENKGTTNGIVTASWNESNVTAYLNGEPYTSGTEITIANLYELIVMDDCGNLTYMSWIIDLEAPSYSIEGVTEDGRTNNTVKIVFDEGYATLNGEPYTSGTEITMDNFYEIILTDDYNNSISFSFEIDTIGITPILNGVESNKSTNTSVIATWDGDATATLNGEPYTKRQEIKAEGNYELIIIDDINNITRTYFSIDLTPVEFTLTGVENNGITNKTVMITFDEGTATLNGEPYTSGSIINEENDYHFIIEDFVGNKTEVLFKIDLTAPTGTLTGVTNGGVTNSSVSFTWTERNCSATLIDADGNEVEYEKDANIKAEGVYCLILKDSCGNTAEFTFEIDKKSIDVVLDGVENNGITNKTVMITFDEGTATLNGQTYTSGTPISIEGHHIFEIQDTAGNSKIIEFDIDITSPSYNFSSAEVEDGGKTNQTIKINWDEHGLTATLNGEPYNEGNSISKSGQYVFILFDRAGNRSELKFEISKEMNLDSLELYTFVETGEQLEEGIVPNEKYVSEVPFKISSKYTMTITKDGEEPVVYISGTKVSEPGKYVVTLFDDYGNESKIYVEIKTPEDEENPYIVNNIATIIVISLLAILAGAIIIFIFRSRIKNPYKLRKTRI